MLVNALAEDFDLDKIEQRKIFDAEIDEKNKVIAALKVDMRKLEVEKMELAEKILRE